MQRARLVLPLLFCTLVAGSASAGPVNAQSDTVIFDNIPSELNSLAYSTYAGTTADNLWALEFETPDGDPMDLVNVELALSSWAIAGTPPQYLDTAGVYLYEDSSNQPGSEIQEIGTQTMTNYLLAGPLLYTFTPGTTIELKPDTQYWVVLADTNYSTNDQIAWWDEAGFSSTEPSAGITYEYNAEWTGSAWTTDQANYATGWLPVMQVSVTPASTTTPEPVSAALTGAGILLLGFLLRRRRAC